MFRCDECKKLFYRPMNYTEDTGEEFLACPYCKTTSYTEVFLCLVCDKYKHEQDIKDHICYKCAKKAYTNRLGLLFLDKHDDFLLWYYETEVDINSRARVIKMFKKDYLDNIDLDNDCKYLEKLKNYILDDENLYDWIKFLEDNLYGRIYESGN